MQGVKIYQEKLFSSFQLSDRVPKDTFYRRLKEVLHLDFLYVDTQMYYGDSGQKSIDPVVFFKLCLVGYLENIISDRKLIAHCSMRLDILYFIGYALMRLYRGIQLLVGHASYFQNRFLKKYLPPHSTYKGDPDGFEYVKSEDYYICPNGAIVPFKKVFKDYRTHTLKKEYRISSKLCRECPLASSCLGRTAKEKKFSVTYYREEYEHNNTRLSTPKGKAMKAKRQSTVEPVFGTLTQFMGMRKVNTIGIKQANKVMHLSAMAYNLKKYLKYTTKKVKSGMGSYSLHFCSQMILQNFIKVDLGDLNLRLYQLR